MSGIYVYVSVYLCFLADIDMFNFPTEWQSKKQNKSKFLVHDPYNMTSRFAGNKQSPDLIFIRSLTEGISIFFYLLHLNEIV